MSRVRRRDEAGVALLLVLMIVSLSAGLVLTFGTTTITDVIGAQQRIDYGRALQLARSGIPIAKRALLDDVGETSSNLSRAVDGRQDAWAVLGEAKLPGPDGGFLEVRIRDAGERIAINAILDEEGRVNDRGRAFLKAALEKVIDNIPGRREDKRYDVEEIADGIIDWLDSDEQTRLGDNEADFYKDRRAEATPVDRPILNLGELAEVPGVDSRLLRALGQYFGPTPTFPRFAGSGVNPNTAPPHVLSMVYLVAGEDDGRFLEDDDVFRILKARRDNLVFCPEGGAGEEACTSFEGTIGRGGETVFPALVYQSQIFAVESRAQIGEARACVSAVLDRSDPQDLRILAYRLECE